jgi:hypothetical protein
MQHRVEESAPSDSRVLCFNTENLDRARPLKFHEQARAPLQDAFLVRSFDSLPNMNMVCSTSPTTPRIQPKPRAR